MRVLIVDIHNIGSVKQEKYQQEGEKDSNSINHPHNLSW